MKRPMQPYSQLDWQVCDRFLEIRSRWLTLIGEHLQDHQGNQLEYWRVEKADSVIVLPIQNDRLLLPVPSYRPGVSQVTLDFPGGRLPEGQSPEQAAVQILKRELGVEAANLTALNSIGWAVNSSFSNQKLFGWIAQIDTSAPLQSDLVAVSYPATFAGVQNLLEELTCLQCRTVLLEWWLHHSKGQPNNR